MAGQETIRDVVIRVALQHMQGMAGAPAGGGTAAAGGSGSPQAQTAQVQSFARETKSQFTSLKQVVEDYYETWYKAADRRMQDVINKHEGLRLKQIEIAEKTAAHQRQKAEEAVAAQKKVEASTIQAINATRQLGESVTLLARGYVLLGASNEKEVEKIMHSLLAVQGAMDVYKGLTGTLAGLAQAYRAVSAAAAAASVAQAAAASAGGGAAAGGILSALAGTALGAGALVAAPVAAGAGIGFGLHQYITGDAQKSIDRQNAQKIIRQGELDFVRRRETDASNAEFSDENRRLLDSFNLAGRRRDFDLSEAGFGFSQATGALGRARTVAERFAASGQQVAALNRQRALLSGQGAELGGELGTAQAQRARAAARVDALAGVAAPVSDIENQRKAALEQRMQAERNILDITERQQKNRLQQLQTQRQQAELARDQLQAEKDRVNASNRGIGSLNEGVLDEARRIASKVRGGGKASVEDLRFLEQEGGGVFSEFTQKERQALGAERNKGGELDVLVGGASRIADFEKNLTDALKGVNGDEEAALLKQVKDSFDKVKDAMQALADSAKGVDTLVNAINRITETLARMEKENAIRAVVR